MAHVPDFGPSNHEYIHASFREDNVDYGASSVFTGAVLLPTDEHHGVVAVAEVQEPYIASNSQLLNLVGALTHYRTTGLAPVLSKVGLWSGTHVEGSLRVGRAIFPTTVQVCDRIATIPLPPERSLPTFKPYDGYHYTAEEGLRSIAEDDAFLVSTRAAKGRRTMIDDQFNHLPAQCALPVSARQLLREQAAQALDGSLPSNPRSPYRHTKKTPAERFMYDLDSTISSVGIGHMLDDTTIPSPFCRGKMMRHYRDLFNIDPDQAYELADDTFRHVALLRHSVTPQTSEPTFEDYLI